MNQPPKIEGDKTRQPVNMQAALIMRPASWMHKPPVEIEPAFISIEKYNDMKSKYEQEKTNLLAAKFELAKTKKELSKVIKRYDQSEAELNKVLKQLANTLRQASPENKNSLNRCGSLAKLNSI